MNPAIHQLISSFSAENIPTARKELLQPLAEVLKRYHEEGLAIRMNFICTHNSRRSHLAQVWAQTLAEYFQMPGVSCYSGGTEYTALFPKVADTLQEHGFQVLKISEGVNPVYAIKWDEVSPPIHCFSKVYHHAYNPVGGYIAVLTCDTADEGCPVVLGADHRFAITYQDPKKFDNTELQTEKYRERSIQIAQELWWVFSLAVQ